MLIVVMCLGVGNEICITIQKLKAIGDQLTLILKNIIIEKDLNLISEKLLKVAQ